MGGRRGKIPDLLYALTTSERGELSARNAALDWLLRLSPSPHPRSKNDLDAALAEERDW